MVSNSDPILEHKVARKHVTPAQIALAWLLSQKPWIVRIPGTTKLSRLEENIGATAVELTSEDLIEIGDAVSKIPVTADWPPEGALAMTGRRAFGGYLDRCEACAQKANSCQVGLRAFQGVVRIRINFCQFPRQSPAYASTRTVSSSEGTPCHSHSIVSGSSKHLNEKDFASERSSFTVRLTVIRFRLAPIVDDRSRQTISGQCLRGERRPRFPRTSSSRSARMTMIFK